MKMARDWMGSRSLVCLLALGAIGCGASPAAAPDLQTLCRDDGACGGRTPRCDRGTGQCVACLVDAHCPVGTICRGNACVMGLSLIHI